MFDISGYDGRPWTVGHGVETSGSFRASALSGAYYGKAGLSGR